MILVGGFSVWSDLWTDDNLNPISEIRNPDKGLTHPEPELRAWCLMYRLSLKYGCEQRRAMNRCITYTPPIIFIGTPTAGSWEHTQ